VHCPSRRRSRQHRCRRARHSPAERLCLRHFATSTRRRRAPPPPTAGRRARSRKRATRWCKRAASQYFNSAGFVSRLAAVPVPDRRSRRSFP
jgi:hypothetical protein